MPLLNGRLGFVMRTSDLVRGKLSTPASAPNGLGDPTPPAEPPAKVEAPAVEAVPAISMDEPVPQISVEPAAETQMPVDEMPSMARGQALYNSAVNYLQELSERLKTAGMPSHLEQPLRIIREMIAEPALVDEMYRFTLLFGHDDDYEIASPVNNMIYCYKIGLRMGYEPFNLTEICLAALHHDIGMLLIPQSILGKTGELTSSELAEIRRHTATGRDLLRPFDRTYPNLSRAVYEHHERESGQGYPQGLKGDRISEYAKIVGICDSYEAMTHNRPHRKGAAQYLSVLELAETKSVYFAPHIVKVFLDELTMYPVGSYVRLNNNAVGVVVGTNRSNPFKPTVRIVADGQGNRVSDEKLIDLSENAILNIVTGISAEAVAQ